MVIICSLDDVQKVALCVGARIEISEGRQTMESLTSPFVWGRGLKSIPPGGSGYRSMVALCVGARIEIQPELQSHPGRRCRPLCGGED